MLSRPRDHRSTCPAPLSPEARAWELEQLRALGLEDDDWSSDDQCPFCAGRPLSVESKREQG
ncbi:hypothetical protein [Sorangium sp. So ce854]|uniref:Uncharacterized protein n=1 Tax=Sorangium cellulosum TaxID=56 RepID=A0A150PJN1_SORCE|nr:hypothetical protein BE08_25070 [Sorangium cellulosum]